MIFSSICLAGSVGLSPSLPPLLFLSLFFPSAALTTPFNLCLIRSSLSCFLMKSFPLLSSPYRSQFPRVKSPGPAICLLNNSCPTNCSGIERSCYGAGQTTFSPHINFQEFQGKSVFCCSRWERNRLAFSALEKHTFRHFPQPNLKSVKTGALPPSASAVTISVNVWKWS